MTRPRGDDPRVARSLGASVLLHAVDAGITTVWGAAAQSRTGTAVTRACRQWRECSPSERWSMMGVALVTASLVHVGLTLTHDAPPGWLWLMPPAIAATIGVLLLGAHRPVKAQRD